MRTILIIQLVTLTMLSFFFNNFSKDLDHRAKYLHPAGWDPDQSGPSQCRWGAGCTKYIKFLIFSFESWKKNFL